MDASAKTAARDDADALRELLALVGSATRLVFSIRVAECAVVGASAGALTLAAAIASSRAIDPSSAIVSGSAIVSQAARWAAGLGALFAALGWWLERRPDVASVVRRIDRREGWNGELVTAFETGRKNAARRDATDIERALAQRVTAKLSLARCMRAVAPSSVALLALPFACAAVLLFAIDSVRDAAGSEENGNAIASSTGSARVEAAISALTSASRNLRSAAAGGSISPERTRELSALADDSDTLRRELERGRVPADASSKLADRAARARALAADERAAAGEPASLAHDTDLDRAARALSAAREDLALGRELAARAPPESATTGSADDRSSSAPGSASTPDSTGRSASGSTTDARAAVDRDRAARSERESELANPVPPATEDRAATGAADSAAAASSPTEERGTTGGRWWSPRYDAVVARWVETRRANAAAAPRGR